jgi:hypothetical protein
VSITGNSGNQVIGTILAPSRNVTVGGGGSLAGNIIAGVNNVGKAVTLQTQSSGFNITSFTYKPSTGGGGGKVPEPSSILPFGSGIVLLMIVRRRKSRA